MSQPGGVCGISWPPLTPLSLPSHLHGEVTAGCVCLETLLLLEREVGGGGGKGREPGSLGLWAPARGSRSRVLWNPEAWCGCFGRGYFPWKGCCRRLQVLLGVLKSYFSASCGESLNINIEVAVITLQSEHSLDQEKLNQMQPFLQGLSERIRLKMNHLQLATMAVWGCTVAERSTAYSSCLYRNIIQTHIYILLQPAMCKPWPGPQSCMLPALWSLSNVLLKGIHQVCMMLPSSLSCSASPLAQAKLVLPGKQRLITPSQTRYLSRGLSVEVSRIYL